MSKKTLYIILISAIILAVIGWLVWYFMLKPPKTAAPASGANFTVPGQPIQKSSLQAISIGPVVSFSQKNGVISFYDFLGQLWQLNETEANPALANQSPIKNLSEIIWPKAASPDGKKIAYLKNGGLFTSDPGGKNQRTLSSNLKLQDIALYWPNAANIALISKPSGLADGSLWYFNTSRFGLKKIIGNFFGLEALFSPSGESFIYSYTDENGQNPKLAVYDKKGNSKAIGNIATLAGKCSWAKDDVNIYCAVPKLWPDGEILPDDYYKNAFLTSDDIWKINTETGEKSLIAQEAGSVLGLAVSEDESSIFFTSQETQFLYKLAIR